MFHKPCKQHALRVACITAEFAGVLLILSFRWASKHRLTRCICIATPEDVLKERAPGLGLQLAELCQA